MTVRAGMGQLIAELRGMTEAGTADYTIAGATYWTDGQLQAILDGHRVDLVFAPLKPAPTYGAGGSLIYKDYYSAYGNFERALSGTAAFYVQDGNYNTVAPERYTPDYGRGMITFGTITGTGGTTDYYITGRAYDLFGAAADTWRRKMSHYATSVNFSTDNHSVSMGAIIDNCMKMSNYFESKAGTYGQTIAGVNSADISRPDTEGVCYDID